MVELNNSEQKLFTTKRQVTDGYGLAKSRNRGTDYTFDSELQRKAQVLDSRNGIGEYNPGDKPYANPICAPGYFIQVKESRQSVSAFDPRRTNQDKILLETKRQNEEAKVRMKEAMLVKELDNWMPPAIAKRLEEEKQAELKRQQDEAKNKKGKKEPAKKDAKKGPSPVPTKKETPKKKK
jgi:hypothetical protein